MKSEKKRWFYTNLSIDFAIDCYVDCWIGWFGLY